jgi:hypothetical protein
MHNRFDELLSAFLLLALAVIIGFDRFVIQTSLTQFIAGLLVGLTLVGSIVYIYRVASHNAQRR